MQPSDYLKFHHLGLAVRNPGRAEVFLKTLGYGVGEEVYDPLQKVNLKLCIHSSQPVVELVYKRGTEPTPIDGFLAKGAEMIYHLCYETQDFSRALTDFKTQGNWFIEVSAPKPAVLFQGRLVAFYYVGGFGLIELLEPAGCGEKSK